MSESDRLVPKLVSLLEDFTQDWDRDSEAPMTRDTKLLADLGFESIDIIQLLVAIEQDITHKKVPFDQLLMSKGRYVDDLSIGQIADFLAQHTA
ncbi:acyl carrier protein [Solimonas aquatica]|uniref:Acyl carrier protein n=1 Tax=Solimonas aquatica TaxID=489703 RepID=A0A1H9KA41_9GAMM|nr:phosphopantetheine-binding protein [Solimonas aquatica]SEQ95928.1 acyl carrier protein [Solimonas aquatica]